MNVEIDLIKDMTHYKTLLIKTENGMRKIHVPTFEGGKVLVAFEDENGAVRNIDEVNIGIERK